MRDYLLEGKDRDRTTPKSSRIGFSANVAFSREDPQRHHGKFRVRTSLRPICIF